VLLLALLCLPMWSGGASAASGEVLLVVDGGSKRYVDSRGSGYLLGDAELTSKWAVAFGRRILTSVEGRSDPRLGGFPYGVYGIDETDADRDMNYTDAGDVDPAALMADIASEGVYNVGVSLSTGKVGVDKITRNLTYARKYGLKLIVRSLAADPATGEMDATRTRESLARFQEVFREHPELRAQVYAFITYLEPRGDRVPLTELQAAYRLHKSVFPSIPVMAVFNQRFNVADSNHDGVSDGALGQPLNPYGPNVADIVALDVYPVLPDSYGYDTISRQYVHARRVVDRVDAQTGKRTPIWAFAQAHALNIDPNDRPEPHQLYRQVNDWLRAGPEAGLRGVDGLIWYAWHFTSGREQSHVDLEDVPANREMARLIGQQLKAGRFVTHDRPYSPELVVEPGKYLRVRSSGHINLSAGTIALAIGHQWPGNDGRAHVLLDTGGSSTRNRLRIEKTSTNVLRLVITDRYGRTKWVGMNVGDANMPGKRYWPGYSEIAATWNNGAMAIYLDGVRGGLSGGNGTGQLSGVGEYIYLGASLSGGSSAEGTLRHITIRSAAGTTTEVRRWTLYAPLTQSPGRPTGLGPSATTITDPTPTLRWGASPSATTYEVQVSRSSSFGTVLLSREITSTSWTVPSSRPLTRGVRYYWRVRAKDRYGMGPWATASFYLK